MGEKNKILGSVEINAEDPIFYKNTVWKDIFGRVISKNLDTAVGHWDWVDGYFRADNTANISNSSHALYVLCQLNHDVDYREGAYTSLHIHWKQEQNPTTNSPKWKLQHKVIPTGGAVPTAWIDDTVLVENVFDYDNAGQQDQITLFSHIDISGLNSSSRIIFRIWRDGTNVADTYQQYLYISDFDIHVPIYTAGSNNENGR